MKPASAPTLVKVIKMAQKQIIKRKNAMALLRQDDAEGKPTIHRIKYRKLDGSIGRKMRVAKSFRHLPGDGKYRGHVKLNHVFLFYDHDTKETFNVLIDLLIEVDGLIIDHTNNEFSTSI
jgi:hypothetical protein